MLKYLHIENIAVIEKCDIDFNDGFTSLTGETGAGKSIVIDSINAVLGQRTSKELIRTGCENAEVSAVFCNLPREAKDFLCENGIEEDSDGNIIISRRMSLSGKSIIKINGAPVTASFLRDASRYILNIHGQHDNQALLDPDNHCDFIDLLADNKKAKENYYSEFKKLNSIRKELEALQMDEDAKLRKIDLLKYQISEIEAAQIKVGEVESLKTQLSIVKNLEKNMRSLNEAYFALKGDDNNDGAAALCLMAKRALSGIEDKTISAAAEHLAEAAELLNGVSEDIREMSDSLSLNSMSPDEINERLDLLHKLMLKYGEDEDKILAFLESAKTELTDIEFSDKKIDELSVALDDSTEKLISLGENLTKSRQKAAKEFEKQVCEILSYLNMPNVKFLVDMNKGRYTKNGCDTVEFLISANVGEDAKPLHKTASGGELSRVMLAIKSVLSNKDTVDTLIFDEIDTGISGYAAARVANQLKSVASNRQVICVTHLAQIAAKADNHLLISKNAENGRTYTSVKSLGYEERIGEIARIMSGSEITENLYNSAKELLDSGKE
ncbi:MAG: DNA repair protein RecN [Clostridia bacterium]|nr:DNA repair protein RecN [Clostridia bacterium]